MKRAASKRADLAPPFAFFSPFLHCLCCPPGYVGSQLSSISQVLGGFADNPVEWSRQAALEWYKWRGQTSGRSSTRKAALPPVRQCITRRAQPYQQHPRETEHRSHLGLDEGPAASSAAAHEKGPWRTKRISFRACTEANGFTVPSDLQPLRAGTASPLLPRFPSLEEQGYLPVTAYLPPSQASSGTHNSSLIPWPLSL